VKQFLNRRVSPPERIVRDESRRLQEAVNALFNSRTAAKVLPWYWPKPWQSLDEEVRDAAGRLISKATDFSARAVVVPDTDIPVGSIGLPLCLVEEVFKPFAVATLLSAGHAANARTARALMSREPLPIVAWGALLDALHDRPVLIVSDRLQIAVLRPLVVNGEALRIHPEEGMKLALRYAGDQLTTHVPVTHAAVRELMEPARPTTVEESRLPTEMTPEQLTSVSLAGVSLPLGLIDRIALGVSGLLKDEPARTLPLPPDPTNFLRRLPLTDLQLSRRTHRCLAQQGITTIGQLLERRPRELYDGWSFGLRCLQEVRAKLGRLVLRLRRDRFWRS
jgi:hypothetical protein